MVRETDAEKKDVEKKELSEASQKPKKAPKTDEWKKRILSINNNVKVKIINEKIGENNINKLFEEHYDFIIDACDTVIVMKLLIKIAKKENYLKY